MSILSPSKPFLPSERISSVSQKVTGRDDWDRRRGVSEPMVSRWVKWGRWMFRHRGWIFSPLGAILFFQAFTQYGERRSEDGAVVSAVWLGAFGLLALGVFIRLHVAGRARPGTSSRGVTFEAGQLITNGMYAYVRNPLYLANLTIWAGLALLAAPVWWAGLLVGLVGIVYHLIVLAEEEYLGSRYPIQYAEYCRQVPRWIPRLGQLFRIGWTKSAPTFPTDKDVLYLAVVLPKPFMSGIGKLSEEQSSCQASERLPTSANPSPHSGKAFTWRRALFREADSIMLVLLAGWTLAGFGAGRLPWQLPPGRLGAIGLGLLVAAAVGWGWIKWLKKRSWPSGRQTSPPGTLERVSSFDPGEGALSQPGTKIDCFGTLQPNEVKHSL